MTPLICERCGLEIKPGSKVEIVAKDDVIGPGIYTDDDMIIAHKDCPATGLGKSAKAEAAR